MKTNHFYSRIARLMRVFWIATACNASYILYYITEFLRAPGTAMAHGAALSTVPAMTEHVLMSVVLLALGGLCAELLQKER